MGFARHSILILLLATAGAAIARADSSAVDPYNCYQWNRDNYEAGNGVVDTGNWYEWWYYKAVLPETHEAVLFTYGVVNPWDVEGSSPSSEASVSFGELNSGLFVENKFPLSQFEASYDKPYVNVAGDTATDQRISGSLLRSDGKKVRWDISIEHDWTFDAMGWATGQNWLSNIFWYPAQASAYMTGWIDTGDRVLRLDHVPAYQDRNWGRSFPKWWAWLVSNHFEGSPGTVLAAGGGRPSVFDAVPLFDAFSIGLRHEGHEYVFRTTNGDPIHADIHFGKWELDANNLAGERIQISAFAPKEDFIDLPFDTPEGGRFHDYEALLGDIHVQLYKGDHQIADLFTHEGGIEYGSPHTQEFGQFFDSEIKLR